MESLEKEKQVEKLRQLIWSNAADTDLLALEIIKTNGFFQVLKTELIAVAKITEEAVVKIAYEAFFQNGNSVKIKSIKHWL